MKAARKKQKLLFFYLKLGGGHIACARSIAAYLETKYKSRYEIVMCDAFEQSPILKRFYEEAYRISQNYAIWAFDITFELNKIPAYWAQTQLLAKIVLEDYVEQRILEEKPDRIAVFHCLVIKPVERTLARHNLKIPFFSVVTDPFDTPKMWFTSKHTRYILSTQTSLGVALKNGTPRSNCHICGTYMLNPKYSKRLGPKKIGSLKKELGLSGSKPIILLLGGGDGIPQGMRLVRTLLKKKMDAEILLVSGRNPLLQRQAEKLSKKHSNLHVYGFVDFIYELLNVSDVVITKCGASVIMEILMQGKLPIINSYLGDQEKSNMEFVVKNKIGFYEPKISKLPKLIKSILKNKQVYALFRKNLSRLKLKNATPEIAEYIVKFRRQGN